MPVEIGEPKPKLEKVNQGDKHCCHVFVVEIVDVYTEKMECKYCSALRLVHYKENKLRLDVNFSRIF